MLFLGCSILASLSWTSLAWSAKKYKCALEPRGPQFHLQPELWILPGKESWETDNISSGSLPAKTVQNYRKCLESATQFELLYQSPCLLCDWTWLSLAVLFIGLLVRGAYLDAGYNPLHVLPGHPRHDSRTDRVTAPHNFLLQWMCHTRHHSGLQRVTLSASLVMWPEACDTFRHASLKWTMTQ